MQNFEASMFTKVTWSERSSCEKSLFSRGIWVPDKHFRSKQNNSQGRNRCLSRVVELLGLLVLTKSASLTWNRSQTVLAKSDKKTQGRQPKGRLFLKETKLGRAIHEPMPVSGETFDGLSRPLVRCVPHCATKPCAVHPVFARVVGKPGAADPRICSKHYDSKC